MIFAQVLERIYSGLLKYYVYEEDFVRERLFFGYKYTGTFNERVSVVLRVTAQGQLSLILVQ